MSDREQKIKLLNRVALVAGIFTLVMCLLVILNYLQMATTSPIESDAMAKLLLRLGENPQDEELRQQIQAFDLLARKAYFTNLWQVRFGGYLIFIGMLITVIALQVARSERGIVPDLSTAIPNDWQSRLLARKWIAIGGGILFAVALLATFLTHNELSPATLLATSQTDTSAHIVQNSTATTNETSAEPQDVTTDSVENQPTDTTQTTVVTDNATLSEWPTTDEIRQNHPAFRGVGSIGISYRKNVPTSWDGASGKNVRWKSPVPKKGFNSPIVWGNKIFLAGADKAGKEIYCYDLATGKLLWTHKADKIDGSPAAAPTVTDDTGLAAPTLTTDGRRVYAIFANGDVLCTDIDGKRLWARNIGQPDNHYGHSSSLITYRNVLIVQFDHNKSASIKGLDVLTGKQLWNTPRKSKISWASPVLAYTGSRMEVILTADPDVVAYNPLTGKELWRAEGVYGEVGASVAYADGVVYTANEYARLVAIQMGDAPKELWETNDYLPEAASPVATDKYLFVNTSYGATACYDAKTGEKYWEHEYSNGFYASPMLVGGRIYMMDRNGVMHIAAADKVFKSIADPALGESSDCTPAFVDGAIVIRGKNNLYCIGK